MFVYYYWCEFERHLYIAKAILNSFLLKNLLNTLASWYQDVRPLFLSGIQLCILIWREKTIFSFKNLNYTEIYLLLYILFHEMDFILLQSKTLFTFNFKGSHFKNVCLFVKLKKKQVKKMQKIYLWKIM